MATSFKLNPGITLGSGITLTPPGYSGSGGGPVPGDITLTFTEFNYPSGIPTPINFNDPYATISGTGFTITNPSYSGVAMFGLAALNLAFAAANLPDSIPGVDGEIWTANWSSGSTYNSTPVAIYYSSTSGSGNPVLTFWILDPADNTYNTGTAGTFNLPMTLTAGTTTTTFGSI
jgi:hypothetical protein